MEIGQREKRLNNIGDMPIIDTGKGRSALFKKTTRTPVSGAKHMTTVEFHGGGTGFLVSQGEILIKERPKKFALVLTAAHVVFDLMTNEEINLTFRCCLESNKVRVLHLLKVFLNLSNDSYRSSFTNFCYCASGDIALLLLKLKQSDNVNHYDIRTRMPPGSPCFISGYPNKGNDFSNLMPQLSGEKDYLIYAKANEIFCKFDGLVYSEGIMVYNENGLMEVSCSTASGMSGSPIVSNYEAIGVYVGGPPLPGQKEILNVIRKINQREDIRQILCDMKEIASFENHYRFGIIHRLNDSDQLEKIEILNRVKNREKITESEKEKYSLLISNLNCLNRKIKQEMKFLGTTLFTEFNFLVQYFKSKELLQANVGVSSDSDVFQQVFERIERFKAIDRAGSTIEVVNRLK